MAAVVTRNNDRRTQFQDNLSFILTTKIALCNVNKELPADMFPYSYLHPKQFDCVKSALSTDTMAVLPTGYGKSLIFQVLQKITRKTVIVVSPLNSIIEQQLQKFVGSHRTTHLTSMKSLSSVSFIIDHPEKFLTDEMFALFRTASDDISHIVIDEAHIIQKWGANFRQQYSKLQKLRAVLPAAKVLALTGSAGMETVKQIKSSLLMRNVLEIRAPLSRPNIKLSVKTRLSNFHIEESFKQVLHPVIQELKEDPDKFGKTVVYSDLKWCGFGYQECLRCYPDLRNKMAQYHAPCTESMRKDVMDGMSEGRIQLLFATEAYSMGTDIKDIRRIIHFGVPKSIETYIQEVGRAGRDGKQAESVLFFNNNDIASNRRHIEAAVADYCKETGCRWEFLCKYFNCSTNLNPNKHDCCDNCSKSCTCYDCSDFDMEVLDSTEVNSEHNSFSQEKADMVFGTLIEYFKSENIETSELYTGLTSTVARKLSKNYEIYTKKDRISADFKNLNQQYQNNIAVIISEITRLN